MRREGVRTWFWTPLMKVLNSRKRDVRRLLPQADPDEAANATPLRLRPCQDLYGIDVFMSEDWLRGDSSSDFHDMDCAVSKSAPYRPSFIVGHVLMST